MSQLTAPHSHRWIQWTTLLIYAPGRDAIRSGLLVLDEETDQLYFQLIENVESLNLGEDITEVWV